jgi:glycosyltransferase involved in cell wall biosynthesis
MGRSADFIEISSQIPKDMKVLLLSRYGRLGASSRIRFYQYIPYLESHGVEVTASPLFSDKYLRHLYSQKSRPLKEVIKSYVSRCAKAPVISGYDLIWLEKEFLPFFPAWLENLLHFCGIPYVVDYDDATFHAYDRHPSRFVRAMMGSKIDRVMRRGVLVIAGNDYLADRARGAGAKRVACLPSIVDTDKYTAPLPRSQDVFSIGWTGSPSTARYLNPLRTALSEVCGGSKGRLVLVGSGSVELSGVPLEIRPWTEETEIADIHSFDVGIMPLPDDSWGRGKCGYKLIQCMACGRPVVASPVGTNRRIVDDGINGFLAETEEDWVRALRTLRDDRALRIKMGKAARRKVESEYSLRINAPRLLALLRGAVEETSECAE